MGKFLMTDKEIITYLISRYGDKVLPAEPFPKPYHTSDLTKIKAIYLGCDPSNKKNYRFPFAFALKSNIPKFKTFIKSHSSNLQLVGLSWEVLYVQNLCQNYFEDETSKNLPIWKKVAKEFWIERLVEELSKFSLNIPVLLTSQYLLEVLGKDGYERKLAPEFYQCEEKIPIKPEHNLLNRPLIPFYRGKSPRFKVNYHLTNHDWDEYKTRIINYLNTH